MNAFAALADNNRKMIVEILARRGELGSTQISREFKISPPAVSQHLAVLREVNILKMRKQAQSRLYSINKEGIFEIDSWIQKIKGQWEERLDSLEDYLEKM